MKRKFEKIYNVKCLANVNKLNYIFFEVLKQLKRYISDLINYVQKQFILISLVLYFFF